MFQGLNVVAFIPARGGSKGLPGKNLMKLEGRSLIRRAIESTQLTDDFEGFADMIVVSSDSAEILAEANAAVPRRPANRGGARTNRHRRRAPCGCDRRVRSRG